jgi:hypothetical protein
MFHADPTIRLFSGPNSGDLIEVEKPAKTMDYVR